MVNGCTKCGVWLWNTIQPLKEGILAHAAMWMSPEDVLNERSQTERRNTVGPHWLRFLEQSRALRKGKCLQGLGRVMRSYHLTGIGFQPEMRKTLWSDGHTTTWVCFQPRQHTVKMIQMLTFCYVYFTKHTHTQNHSPLFSQKHSTFQGVLSVGQKESSTSNSISACLLLQITLNNLSPFNHVRAGGTVLFKNTPWRKVKDHDKSLAKRRQNPWVSSHRLGAYSIIIKTSLFHAPLLTPKHRFPPHRDCHAHRQLQPPFIPLQLCYYHKETWLLSSSLSHGWLTSISCPHCKRITIPRQYQ